MSTKNTSMIKEKDSSPHAETSVTFELLKALEMEKRWAQKCWRAFLFLLIMVSFGALAILITSLYCSRAQAADMGTITIEGHDVPTFIPPGQIGFLPVTGETTCNARSAHAKTSLTLIKEKDSSPIPAPGIYNLSYEFVVIFHFNPQPPLHDFSSYYFVNNSDKEIIIMRCVG